MRACIVADVHVGNHKRFGGGVTGGINVRCRMVLDTLEAAVQGALAQKADAFIVAGDLLDYARPEAQILTEVQRILLPLGKAGCYSYLLRGNHEMVSGAPGDHALGPLASAWVRVVEEPETHAVRGGELLLVPFRSGAAKDWLPGALRALVGDPTTSPPATPRLLAVHMGIRDEKTPPWLANAPDAIDASTLLGLMADHWIAHCVAGNWHDRKRWIAGVASGSEIQQCGALAPTGWDNPGAKGYGTLVTWDSGSKLTWAELPGPRFLKTRTRDELEAALKFAASKPENRVFISDTAAPEDIAERVAFLQQACETYDLAGVEVLPDETTALVQARTAASAARSAESMEEALKAFVTSMPLPDHVHRDAVFNRSREYLL